MGNYKFKFSDMIPNAWFYKLKDMSKSKKHQNLTNPLKRNTSLVSPISQIPRLSESGKSDKFCHNSPVHPKASDTHFPDPPRKSSKSKRKSLYKPSPKIVSSNVPHTRICHNSVDSVNSALPNSSLTRSDSFDSLSDLKLPPILTKPGPKPGRNPSKSLSVKLVRRDSNPVPVRNSSAGIRLRGNSPRIGNRKIQGYGRKNRRIAESFAVVKSSDDPEKDFMESMVEMIVGNNMKGSKELEDLLACYISLNSSEYHFHIIQAFHQILLHMNHLIL